MECPVCYEIKELIHTECGHSFCYQCTKNWYQNTVHFDCPMCRRNMGFNGKTIMKNRWNEGSLTHEHFTNQDICLKEYENLKKLQDRYNVSGIYDTRYIIQSGATTKIINFMNKG